MVPVKPAIAATAHVSSLHEYRRLYKRSIESPEAFWGEMAQGLQWFNQPDAIVDAQLEGDIDINWFPGGR